MFYVETNCLWELQLEVIHKAAVEAHYESQLERNLFDVQKL